MISGSDQVSGSTTLLLLLRVCRQCIFYEEEYIHGTYPKMVGQIAVRTRGVN